MTKNQFSVRELLAQARDRTGCSDFGPDDFREGLDVLVAGLNTDTVIPADRVMPLRENILRLLTNRLWMQKDLNDHPEILDEELRSPIIISSLPRTGSTKLHRLLGASGDFQQLQYWKAHMFARRPGLPEGGRAQRIAETRAYEKWVYKVCPTMITGHPMFTDEPEEEFHLLKGSFRTVSMGLYGSKSHSAWLRGADPTPGYDYLWVQLKYLQWQFPEDRDKPWILKSPVHHGLEEQLCRIFDKPRFIVTHRDPSRVVPSVVNITQNWTIVYAEPVPNDHLGQDMLALCARHANDHMSWREAFPNVPVLDVSFTEINNDSLDLVRKIYDALGLPWSEKAEEAMQHWSRANPRHKHGENQYSLVRIGLTETSIDDHFSVYREKFSAFF